MRRRTENRSYRENDNLAKFLVDLPGAMGNLALRLRDGGCGRWIVEST